MFNDLKRLLLQIARLPKSDQRWILNQLSAEQHAQLQSHQGMTWLNEAQRFKTLPVPKTTAPVAQEHTLPAFAQTLLLEAPLYAAIVLDQGAFPWQSQLLQNNDQDGAIRQALDALVPDIKEPVKKAVFEEWRQQLPFEHLLEHPHG